MKKMRIIVALTCVLALGLVFTGCSCTKSSTTNSTSSQSASNSSANNGSKDANSTDASKANSTDGATASATDGATANNANANAASNIVGSWKYEKGSGANADYTVVYNADGTGKMINRLAGAEGAFTYTLDNGTVLMKFTDYPQAPTQPIPYVVDGNTLILKYSYGDVYHTKE